MKVWDLASGTEIRTLKGHTDVVTAVAVHSDGNLAVSASWDRTLKVWDLATGAEVATLRGHADSVTGVAMFAAGKRAISASWDRTLKVWDLGASTQTRATSDMALRLRLWRCTAIVPG